MVPNELLADSLYGSEANCKQALDEYGVVVVAPAMPGNVKEQITRQKQIAVAFCVTILPINWNRLEIRF